MGEAPDVADRTAAEAGWAALAPLGVTVAAAPLTAPAREFAVGLAGSQAPEPILLPLGHDLSADGPAGLVAGLATPVLDTHARTTEGPALPMPARVAGRARQLAAPAGGVPVGPQPAETGSAAGGRTASSLLDGSRHIPLAPVAVDARETRRLLTAISDETLRATLEPVVGTSAGPAPTSLTGATPNAGTGMGDAGNEERAGARATALPVAPLAGGIAGPADRTGPGPRPDPAGGPPVARHTVTVRRSGLGAPLAGPPPLATHLPVGPTPAAARTGGDQAAPLPATHPTVTGGRALPPTTLQPRPAPSESERGPDVHRAGAGPAADAHPGGAASTGDGAGAVAAAGSTPSARIARPIPGAWALRPRLSTAPGGRGGPPPGAAPTARVQRSATGAPVGGDAHGTRATGSTRPGDGSERQPALVARPVSGPVRFEPPGLRSGASDRVTAWPGMDAGAFSPPRSSGHPGGRHTASPVPLADPATVRWGPASARALPSARSTAPAGAGSAIQRLGEPSAIAPAPMSALASGEHVAGPFAPGSLSATPSRGGLAVQRAVQVEDVSAEVAGGAGEGAASEVRGTGGAGLAAATDGDLDLLARRLYGRIRDRLRGELLLDRERSGSLADL